MNSIRSIVSVSFPLGVAALLFASVPGSRANDRAVGTPATLTVSGHGEVSARPDRATVRIGVDVRNKEAGAAQNEANDRMQQITKDLKALGIPDESLVTRSIELYPVMSNNNSRGNDTPEIESFHAVNLMEVLVDRIDMTGKVLDTALKAGANRFDGVTFLLRDDHKERSESLRRAVADASAKAQAIVAGLNGRVLSVKEISEDSGGGDGPSPVFRAKGFAMATTPIQPGELKIGADVRVVYSITASTATNLTAKP
jgi:uncharacterized protein YggE